MATNRTSEVMTVLFRIPNNFMWMDEDDISVLRGGNVVTETVEWEQGDPGIGSFVIGDIDINYYSDSGGSTVIATSDAAYDIGDQTLADIITLVDFVDDSDGTGSVDVQVDPSGITNTELTALKNVYIRLSVSQPDPSD